MRLGAEYSAAQIQVPIDHGQHWTAWLLEWAPYSHDAFVAQPALLGQFLNSSLGVDRMVTHVDAVDRRAVTRQGFSLSGSRRRLRDRQRLRARVRSRRDPTGQAARAGRPVAAEYLRVLATRPDDELPHLRALVARQGRAPGRLQRAGADRAGRHRGAPGRAVAPVLAQAARPLTDASSIDRGGAAALDGPLVGAEVRRDDLRVVAHRLRGCLRRASARPRGSTRGR